MATLTNTLIMTMTAERTEMPNDLELVAVQTVPVLPGQVDPSFGAKGVVTRSFGRARRIAPSIRTNTCPRATPTLWLRASTQPATSLALYRRCDSNACA